MIRSLPKSQSHAGPWRAGSLCRVVQSTRLALLIALASAAPAAPLAAQCVGTRIRVSTRLVNGATAVAAWGDVFDRTPDELLALPSLIAREVALHVGGPAPSSEAGVLGTLRTRSPAAYDHYLRGNFFLALRSPEGTARAVAEYREAERLDSGFAAAIGRAAYAHAIARGNYYRLPDAPIESLAV